MDVRSEGSGNKDDALPLAANGALEKRHGVEACREHCIGRLDGGRSGHGVAIRRLEGVTRRPAHSSMPVL